MRVHDIHSHYNHDVPIETQEDNILYKCHISPLEKERQRLNIVSMAVCSFASVINPNAVFEENEHCHNLVENDPFLYQWVVVDPRDKRTYKQAEEMIHSPKCLGIKLHSVMLGYDIMEYADEIFDFANKYHMVVLMHPDHILEVAEKVDNYPDMKLIIAHLGSIEHIEAIKRAKNHNVYTDTSGIASSKNNIIEHAVKQVGSEYILFGTDTYSAAFQLGRIIFANISESDKENILYKNAEKLFKGKL